MNRKIYIIVLVLFSFVLSSCNLPGRAQSADEAADNTADPAAGLRVHVLRRVGRSEGRVRRHGLGQRHLPGDHGWQGHAAVYRIPGG